MCVTDGDFVFTSKKKESLSSFPCLHSKCMTKLYQPFPHNKTFVLAGC